MTSDDSAEDASDHVPSHTHRDVSGGWLRPAVFGAMDGLVTNVSLIAGVGGSGAKDHTILLTGVAGLFAGAFSMGTGEYVSVASQNESIAAEVRVEELELRRHPEEEARELAARYAKKGVAKETARDLAAQVSRDPAEALRLHTREELGVDPEHLPSPWSAAASSFVFFSVGALLPLLPYLLGAANLPLALGISGTALFTAGAVTARFTRRSVWFSGLRQLGLGVLAAGVTYLIGSLVGSPTA
jgi:VIT1/CCC1 family predicted Fe2+/Mn2+ transporter